MKRAHWYIYDELVRREKEDSNKIPTRQYKWASLKGTAKYDVKVGGIPEKVFIPDK